MGNFNKIILTKKGIALIAKAQAKQAQIKFTKLASGNGDYSQNEDLEQATSLKSKKQEFDINETGIVNENIAYIRCDITNQDNTLTEGYYIKELGLFAIDPDEGEILYAITTAIKNQWDYLPPNGNDVVKFIIEFYARVGNADNVSMTIKRGEDGRSIYAVSSVEELDHLDLKVGDLILNMSESQDSKNLLLDKPAAASSNIVIGDLITIVGDIIEVINLNPLTCILKGNLKGKDVNVVDVIEEDNTNPVSSGAVYTVCGNIEILLNNI